MNYNEALKKLHEIKESHLPVNSKGTALDWKIAENGRPDFGGIYVFWWTGQDDDSLWKRTRRKTFVIDGPHHHGQITVKVTQTSFQEASNGFVPLYVGKTFRAIHKRIGQHLTLKANFVDEKSTSNQLRFNLDRLLQKDKNTSGLLEHVALSYIKLDGDKFFTERFYLEDLAIGTLRPFFNLDSER